MSDAIFRTPGPAIAPPIASHTKLWSAPVGAFSRWACVGALAIAAVGCSGGGTPTSAGAVTSPNGLAPGALAAADAQAHVGETATVCGHVATASYQPSSSGGPTYLNLERPYPDQVFTILIWREHRGSYGGSPETLFADKNVCAHGLITTYGGKPQMEGEDTVQVASE